ncbi:MAG TPA: DUF58 domain-containing protein [Verrucomicrobiae bacterium]|jgi:uncharacterized protein (DUF58 family)|nr:DUF58 domain-containing protein [Verrucomicrobiae bacterium]
MSGIFTSVMAWRQRFSRRWLYRNHRAFSLILHRFRRRVTPAGWVAVVMTVVVGALGADTNASLGYQTFGLLACGVALSMLCTPVGRPRVKVERLLPRFGSVGQRLSYRLLVRNESTRPQVALKVIEDLPDPRPTFEEFAGTPEPLEERRSWLDRNYGYYRWRWLLTRNVRAEISEVAVPDLKPGEEASVPAWLSPLRRGTLRLEGLTVACPDPFGFFRSLRQITAPQSILILPRRHPVPAFNLPGTVKYQQGGVSMASSVGESEEFVSLREYRAGDPLRRLHWKSFAKLGKPIVKEFQDEYFVRHALLLDTFGRALDTELFEEAVSLAASLACAIQDQESLLDLMFVGAEAYCFTSGRGIGRMEKMLEILASVQLCAAKPFTELEQLVLDHAVDISGCVCVLLGWDATRQRLVRSLLARGVPAQVFVLTARETALEPGVMAAAPEDFHVIPAGKLAERLAAL